MKWTSFLTDIELNNSERKLNGRYLFGKILHDILECLNIFAKYVELMQKEPFPNQTLDWFKAKNTVVESLLAKITPLWVYEKLPETSSQWPKLIEEVGQIIGDAETLLLDFTQPNMPLNGTYLKVLLRL